MATNPAEDEQAPAASIHLSKEQLDCLASTVRAEIFTSLISLRRASAKELAQVMGRPAQGIYYHLERLVASGLVRKEAAREVKGREEAAYKPIARKIELPPTTDPEMLASIASSVAASLRAAQREHDAALKRLPAQPSLRAALLRQRLVVALDDEGLVELKQALERAARRAREVSDPRNPHRVSLTSILTPLVRLTDTEET